MAISSRREDGHLKIPWATTIMETLTMDTAVVAEATHP